MGVRRSTSPPAKTSRKSPMRHSRVVGFTWTCVLLCPLSGLAAESSPVGRWKTIDDETGRAKSIVEITEHANGVLAGRVVEILQSDRGPDPICDKCKDDRKGRPIKGMEIIRGMKPDGERWSGGSILKPDEGRIYKAKMQLLEGGEKLEVSGCVAFICKAQVWLRQQGSSQ